MAAPSLTELETAAERVRRAMPATPQIAWAALSARAGAEVWVKHENHTPVGAFKLRGGIFYLHRLREREPDCAGVIAATKGNHGQSVTVAAAGAGLRAVIVTPHGSSREKRAAMQAQGAELIEHGADFHEALLYSAALAAERGLHHVPSFHPDLVLGVASYALELFRGAPPLHAVYAPIGLGSGICGLIAARDALGLRTEIIGVVAAGAPAYALSFAAGRPVETGLPETIADGVACRVPDPDALAIILRGAARVVTVTEEEIRAAMRHLFSDTHNVAEGAGSAPVAALLQERERMRGRRVAVILSGGNIDRELYAGILSG